jgi:acetylornithine deacetylase
MNTIDTLARLVGFDTTSRNPNLDLITFARAWLDQHGIAIPRIPRPHRPERPTSTPSSAPTSPAASPSPAMSTSSPSTARPGPATRSFSREANGRLYGRGSADMKGFVASCLAAVPRLKARALKRPVHLFITYDEETDMGGARRLIDDLAESGRAPSMCIVGEPSRMLPILAHKGRLALRVTARGLAGHSSEPGKGRQRHPRRRRSHRLDVAAEQRRFAKEGPFVEGFDPPHTTPHVGTIVRRHHPQHHPRARQLRHGMALRPRRRPRPRGRAPQVPCRRPHRAGHESRRPQRPASTSRSSTTSPAWRWTPTTRWRASPSASPQSNAAGKVSYGTEGGL